MPQVSSRRTAVLAALVSLAPFAAEAGGATTRRRNRRRCPPRDVTPCSIAGDLRECQTACTVAADCPGDAVACLHNRCRYCPSDQWVLVQDRPNQWGGKRCVRAGFSELRAGCEPW